jgi:hypothetical protein
MSLSLVPRKRLLSRYLLAGMPVASTSFEACIVYTHLVLVRKPTGLAIGRSGL